MNNKKTPHRDLHAVWLASFGSLVAAFPLYSYCVFFLGMDRYGVADIFALQVAVAYWVGILAACLPLPSLRSWTRFERLQAVCLPFLLASYITHLSWELVWVFYHDAISAGRESVWAYPWWAYMDGGDMRYYQPETDFLMIEILSLCNGVVGMSGLWLLFRSNFRHLPATLMVMSTAVTHTVLTWYYYGSEALTGFENVNTASFMDLWVKFVFLNGPWLVFPWCVLLWGYGLIRRYSGQN
ncbi:MAG: hypothetical protein CMN85_04070 [Spongiibacteraceae bacterium]|nr:hypothetical protein [Spongiibacteraceae bacterium]|tara:strand:+ start:2436 stop:3155 length:720 start_codon:yes stop_codon:yes gene_type:complete